MNELVETKESNRLDAVEIGGDIAAEALIDGIFGLAENTAGHIGDIIGGVLDSVSIDF